MTAKIFFIALLAAGCLLILAGVAAAGAMALSTAGWTSTIWALAATVNAAIAGYAVPRCLETAVDVASA
jgi:hypothetical protein